MKKRMYAWLLAALFTLPAYTTYAQYVVQKSSNAINTSEEGFFYSLPKTVFKIHLTYETVKKIKGPLSDYTERYLGTSDFIEENREFTRIVDAYVEPVTMADPQETYWVRFPAAEKSKEPVKEAFTLSGMGTLLAFDDIKALPNKKMKVENSMPAPPSEAPFLFPKEAEYNQKKVVDTVVRKITIDTVTINRFLFKSSWVDRTEEEKAQDAAKQVAKIREARYNLLTGFQEVNYGESIKYMDRQLQKLEQQYLELFLGKEVHTLGTKTVTFDPSKNRLNKTVLSFTGEDGNEHQLKIVVLPQPLPEGVSEDAQQKIDNLFYRIPVTAQVKVVMNDQVFFNDFFSVPQLGGIGSVPMGKNKLQFDFLTGTLTKIKREKIY